MVFDASTKPQPTSSSINECMYPGPSLQSLLWDILVQARMCPYLLIGDIQKAFLQIGLSEENRDAFRFLFNLNEKEEHFRFSRIPFDAEVVTGTKVDDLHKFKSEATEILENGKFPVHKWESNVLTLESGNMPNPGKIFGYAWDKVRDTLKFQVRENDVNQLTKRAILSRLGRMYNPLGVISPTTVESKRIYRDTCEDERSWNADVSPRITRQWKNWTKQLQGVEVPSSLVSSGKTKGIDLQRLQLSRTILGSRKDFWPQSLIYPNEIHQCLD